ncbi:unnamed protein product [Thelazia callipaeda]|uniref:TGF_BETA_2 domain-containing protein n=1 Tax=Thelazia callipaeda TaxID=103827 RepID=A0A0N5CSB9_THECL|nr:unnamed protein product [Thelazia callipaeda]
MNKLLDFNKSEIQIKKHTFVQVKFNIPICISSTISTTFLPILFPKNTIESGKVKQKYHFYRNRQRSSLLKAFKSLLFFVIIVIDNSLALRSSATVTVTATKTNRFAEEEIQLLREAFLKKFGMKEQPKQTNPALPVPKYIWDIYEKVKYENVDWVRHYYPSDIHGFDNNTFFLNYDLSVTVQNTSNELISRANLKLKLKKANYRRHIKIYEIDQRNSEIWRLIDAKFIEQSLLYSNYHWIEMDVTEGLRRKRPNMNKVRSWSFALFLNQIDFAVEISSNQMMKQARTSYQRLEFFDLPNDSKRAAALVVYVQSIDNPVKVRRKRKANTRRRHQHKKYHNYRPVVVNYCRRSELLVDFNELNWQDWILAPSSYSAYQCQGICPNPLPSFFNTTNHAIVQGLINSVDPSLVPAPCCVPIEMESLAILYIDVEGKIVIKNYPEMEVLSCGCR